MNGADDNGGRTANSRAKSSYYKIKPAAAAAVYIIIAGIWIFYTDNLVDRLAEPDLITGIQIIKGLFFVAVTVFIFYIVYSKAYLMQRSTPALVFLDTCTATSSLVPFLINSPSPT